MRLIARLKALIRNDSRLKRELAEPVPICTRNGQGYIERIEMSELPVVRVFGWYSGEDFPDLMLSTEERTAVVHRAVARTHRSDVFTSYPDAGPFAGFRADYFLQLNEAPKSLLLFGKKLLDLDPPAGCASVQPHYDHLFNEKRVLSRQHIYGSGPPTTVSDEFKTFCSMASGKILDFGAGNGDLAVHLANQGAEVLGLELDEPRITDALMPEAATLVRVYAGGVPLPFGDDSFDWIVSTEVVEHVTNVETFVPEFARILKPKGKMLLTTPDITSIPSSFPTGTVPWHLLEATHVNFFTPGSLERLFQPHFSPVRFYALATNNVNGWHVPGSIGVIFEKR